LIYLITTIFYTYLKFTHLKNLGLKLGKTTVARLGQGEAVLGEDTREKSDPVHVRKRPSGFGLRG
jgi:hypothetical protein